MKLGVIRSVVAKCPYQLKIRAGRLRGCLRHLEGPEAVAVGLGLQVKPHAEKKNPDFLKK